MTRRLVPLAALLLLGGCGLSDYEGKMIEAQKRLARHDEEERLLGPAIVIPRSNDGKGEKAPIITGLNLRLPQGIAQSANEQAPRIRGAAKLFTFPASAGPFRLVELGVAGDEKGLLSDVLGLYDQTSQPKTTQRTLSPPRRPAVTFETTEFENAELFYSVNRYKADKQQVVVVYCMPKQQKAAAARMMELSLESFALGARESRAAAIGSPLKVPRK